MNIGAAIVPVTTIFLFPRIGKKWTMMASGTFYNFKIIFKFFILNIL